MKHKQVNTSEVYLDFNNNSNNNSNTANLL